MKLDKKRVLVGGVLVLAAAGGVGFAAARTGLVDRVGRAYSEWTLRSRVEKLWQARMEGDLEKARSFVLKSCEPRKGLGGSVQYLSFDVKEIKIIDESAAEVQLGVAYKVGVPGYSSPSSPPEQADMRQRWVRAQGRWYWDTGPPFMPGMQPVALERVNEN